MSNMLPPHDILGKLKNELAKTQDRLDHVLIDVGVPEWHIRDLERKIARLKAAVKRHENETKEKS